LGEDDGCPSSQNAGSLPHLPSEPARRTAIEAETITLTDGTTPMMLESRMH
jgi:hypothetical protein